MAVLRAIAAAVLVAFLASAATAQAGLAFPDLTGRVVDRAHILAPDDVRTLTALLAEHERRTSNQLVIVTLSGLQGTSIEDYGYQLGRHWGIGVKGRDNGVLLIVAPAERKVRIEVGYGLEGRLTDAESNRIIQTAILPRFRSGNMPAGIVAGARAIVSVLEGAPGKDGTSPGQDRNAPVGMWTDDAAWIFFIVFVFVFVVLVLNGPSPGAGRGRRYGGWGGGSSGGSWGGGSGGGFSGGGGGFGGGGSSGSW